MFPISINDPINLLSSSDGDHLQSASERWGFETHILIRKTDTTAALDDQAHAQMTGPGVVVIAVDPINHRTAVRFGTGTHVKAGDFDSIAKAGNAHFRAGEWAAGIEAIGVRAQASAQSKVAMSVSNEPVIIQNGLTTGAWVAIGFMFVSVIGLAVWWWRRSRKELEKAAAALEQNRLETGELISHNARKLDEDSFDDRLAARQRRSREEHAGLALDSRLASRSPGGLGGRTLPTGAAPIGPTGHTGPTYPGGGAGGYSGPNPATVIINQQPSNDGFLTGLLVGEALQPHQTVIEREVVRERYEDPPDSGGSSSPFDGSSSSSGDSGSSDSGGSDSSYDPGGSSDSGGGGDSGGGDASW